MTKLKIIRLYRADDIPDHIFQQVCDLVEKMAVVYGECIKGEAPNVVLSAFNRFHAAMILSFISEEGLEDAAKTEAIALIRNVEHLSGQEIWKS